MTTYTTMTARRNADFLEAFRRSQSELAGGMPTAAEVARFAAGQPAPRYYVSYTYARRVIRERRKQRRSRCKGSCVERMWQTLERAVAKLENRHGIAMEEALQRVLTESRAPSFFIAPATALRIYQIALAASRRARRCHQISEQTTQIHTYHDYNTIDQRHH